MIEWRERDDHVLMTGPVELEFEGTFDPALFDERRRATMSVDVVTFGCRLNAYESEVIRRAAEAAGSPTPWSSTPARSPARRCGRRARRSAGSSASGRRRASSSPAARRRPSREHFAAMPEVDRVLGNDEKLDAASGRCGSSGASRRSSVDDIMAATRHGAARHRRHCRPRRAPSCRCRTAATTAAPSASSRSAAAIRARCRSTTWWRRCAALVAWRLSRGRAHRRRHHQLRRRPAGRAAARRAGASAILRARAGARAAAAVLDRLGRGRSPICSTPSPTSRG